MKSETEIVSYWWLILLWYLLHARTTNINSFILSKTWRQREQMLLLCESLTRDAPMSSQTAALLVTDRLKGEVAHLAALFLFRFYKLPQKWPPHVRVPGLGLRAARSAFFVNNGIACQFLFYLSNQLLLAGWNCCKPFPKNISIQPECTDVFWTVKQNSFIQYPQKGIL